MPPTITAVLIVKNEAAVIERCLASLTGVDEIVVLDTGSGDKTPTLARAYTKIVIGTPPIVPFHFAEARNRANGYASSDWILTIDADEVVEPGGIARLKEELAKVDTLVSGVRVKFIFADDEGKNSSYLKKLKLYRRDSWKWFVRVHEILKPVDSHGRRLDTQLPVSYVDTRITHLPEKQKAKRRRQNLMLLKLSVQEDPWYTRNIRQLGMEHFLLEEWTPAIEQLEIFLGKEQLSTDHLDLSEVSTYIGRAQAKLKNFEEAEAAFDNAIELSPRRREPYYYKAVSLIYQARLDEALATLEACRAIPESEKPEFHLNLEDIWHGKAVHEAIDFCQGEIESAKEKARLRS